MRVVFLGNHTLGVRVLAVLAESADVVGVVAHPLDAEDGVRYDSVFDFARQQSWGAIRGRSKDPQVFDFIARAKPDLLWITDYRYLISREILALAPQGTVNLHPSLLPTYRGRAPVNWAILNGETRLGLTAHFVDEGMDSGDIIEQVSYEIREDQDVGHCIEILYPLYTTMTKRILAHFLAGKVPRTPQDHSRATSFPARKPDDGRIDWNQPVRHILNLIRAVAAPYPGAFTSLNGKKVIIWKARVASETNSAGTPGSIIQRNGDEVHVQCGPGVIALTRIETEATDDELSVGCRLSSVSPIQLRSLTVKA